MDVFEPIPITSQLEKNKNVKLPRGNILRNQNYYIEPMLCGEYRGVSALFAGVWELKTFVFYVASWEETTVSPTSQMNNVHSLENFIIQIKDLLISVHNDYA